MSDYKPGKSKYRSVYLSEVDYLMLYVLDKHVRKNKKSGKIKLDLRKKLTVGAILRGVFGSIYDNPELAEELFGVKNYAELVNAEATKRLSK